MSDLKMNFDELNKACKEVNENWRKMMDKNNPFDTISKIAKDIAERRDKEVSLEFTKDICTLLKNYGVSPMIDEYKQDIVNENSIEQIYGVTITGLDFTEHDKRFKDEIARLKRQIEKLASIRTRCHESARDSFDLGNYGCLHIVTADELKTTKDENDEIKAVRKALRESKDYITQLKHDLEEINCNFSEYKRQAQDRIAELESELETKDVNDRAVELPFDALETANILINATYKAENPFLERKVDRNVYNIDDLEQIAEHLLVYCNHNRENDG